jgi:Flp pilus assembly protein TadG
MSMLRRGGGERGASIVELALISPIMVLLVFGVLDLGRAYRMNIQLENAAREGAAFAQIFPNNVSCGADPDIEDRVRAEEPALASAPDFEIEVLGQDDTDAFVPMSGCSGTTASPGERVRVEVRARYDIMTPLVANAVGRSLELTGHAEVRVQGQVQP